MSGEGERTAETAQDRPWEDWPLADREYAREAVRIRDECTCGWGGQHDPDNSRCAIYSPGSHS